MFIYIVCIISHYQTCNCTRWGAVKKPLMCNSLMGKVFRVNKSEREQPEASGRVWSVE